MPDSNNSAQKVTVGVLGNKMDTLTETVSRAMADAKEDRQALGALATRVTRLEERTKTAQVLQGIATAISTGLGVLFGPRR